MGVWIASADLNTARYLHGGFGAAWNAAMAIGGNAEIVSTEEFNGTSWSAGGDLPAAKNYPGGHGTPTAGLCSAGRTGGSTVATCEEYNGTTWSSGGALTNLRYAHGACGTQTAGLVVGGAHAPASTEEYNGTSWSAGGAYPVQRDQLSAAGTQTIAVGFGGGTGGAPQSDSREYNGTSWSTGGSLNTARFRHGRSGASGTSAFGFAGHDNTNPLSSSEKYNGTSWTTDATVNTGRQYITSVGAGDTSDTLMFGGYAGAILASAEHYDGSIDNYILLAESGAGADAVDVPLVTISISDAGAGADAIDVPLVTVTISEDGYGADVQVVDDGTIKVTVTDTATGTDVASLALKSLTVSDAGTGTDATILMQVVAVTDQGTGNEAVTVTGSNTLAFAVHRFPVGQTVEYRIRDLDTGSLVQDWTSTGVLEDAESASESSYWIKNVEVPNGAQWKISWRIDGTAYYAYETINYFETWLFKGLPTLTEIEASSVLAKEATVETRFAAADYTAPDNAGITAIQAKTNNLPADPASQAKLDFIQQWILNRLVVEDTQIILYDDDGTTPLKTWPWNATTKTRGAAT